MVCKLSPWALRHHYTYMVHWWYIDTWARTSFSVSAITPRFNIHNIPFKWRIWCCCFSVSFCCIKSKQTWIQWWIWVDPIGVHPIRAGAPMEFIEESSWIECYKNQDFSLVNWLQYTSVIGWQKSNKIMTMAWQLPPPIIGSRINAGCIVLYTFYIHIHRVNTTDSNFVFMSKKIIFDNRNFVRTSLHLSLMKQGCKI